MHTALMVGSLTLAGLTACRGDAPALTAPAAGTDSAAPACPAPTWTDPPACGSGAVARGSLIPGPADPSHDAALAAKVTRFDRVFHGVIAWGTGLNTEVQIAEDHPGRDLLTRWLDEDDGFDVEAWSGQPVPDLVDGWSKVAGAYAGVGVAADAFRYGALRDEGADCEAVATARGHLVRGLEGLHRAVALTGTPGVISRGYARTDLPGIGQSVETVPLFDDQGDPLPQDKNNGTWRTDQSGEHPEYVWEDSCSRDMLIGWGIGFGAAWEVIALDPTIDADLKAQLADDAAALARGLMAVGDQGYDLEIPDADGRVTYHGYLHEESVDRVYFPGATNGPNALMALGIVGAYAAASGEPDVVAYLNDTLLGERDLAGTAEVGADLVDFGPGSNFSGYNMGFAGGLLAQRMVCDADAQAKVRGAILDGMYDRPNRDRQPVEQSQALYHLVAALAQQGGSAWAAPDGAPAPATVAATLTVLDEFPAAPFFTEARVNCDEDEIATGLCVADDGTTLTLLGPVGWNDTLIAEEPVPMRIRPHSNYYWRSSPYQVNGGGPGSLYGGVDLRIVYWMGRWVTRGGADR